MNIPSIDDLLDSMRVCNYKIFDKQPNIIGIRAKNHRSDEFTDLLVALWRQPRVITLTMDPMTTLVKQQSLNKWLFTGIDGKPLMEDNLYGANTQHAHNWYMKTENEWRMLFYTQTTVSGLAGLKSPMNPRGTAVLKPGQYVDAYTLGFHKGKPDHPALIQCQNVTVWRDDDRDWLPEEGMEDIGMFGINIHRANPTTVTNYIGKHSYGCQVAKNVEDHKKLIKLCRNFRERGVLNFTYTLMTEEQITTR